MDCRRFRKLHLAYLDDTLSGDLTTEAQQHILACDACAAHDTLVRRSLMIARSMPTIEPSAAFQARLRARLAECRDERNESDATRQADAAFLTSGATRSTGTFSVPRSPRVAPRTLAAVAAGAVIGTMFWRSLGASPTPVIAMQPVIASQPAAMPTPVYSPALISAMSTGNPVWPAAMLVEEASSQFVGSENFRLVGDSR